MTTTTPKGGWLLYGFVALVYTMLTFLVVLDSCAGSPLHTTTTSKPKSVSTHIHTTRSQVLPTRPCSSPYATGMVLPRWTTTGYGPTDTGFQQALPQIRQVSHACWLELPLLFVLHSPSSHVFDMGSMPTPSNLGYGIRLAQTFGFHLFLVPLVTVTIPGGWAGSVQLASVWQEAAWFSAFYHAYAPYLAVAQKTRVEEVSIGTELAWLQRHAPQAVWQQYITNITSTYHGLLTYNTNWGDIDTPIAPWMRSLSTLGISAYFPLVDHPWRIAEPAMEPLFRSKVQTRLDALSRDLGKPILVSEIGYRASEDALYQPWQTSGHLPSDQQEQAQMLSTALSVLTSDPHILGSFVWAWQGAEQMNIEGSPASLAIGSIYGKVEQ